MRGDTFKPTHSAPASSWWAERISYAGWTAMQAIAQRRMSRTGQPLVPGGPKPHATVLAFPPPSARRDNSAA